MPAAAAGGGGAGGVAIPKKVVKSPVWYPTGDPTHQDPVNHSAVSSYGAPVDGGPPGTGGGPAGSLAIPGYNPNYDQLLLSDPAYLAWSNAHPGVVADAATQRQAALRALAMQYGGLPEGFTDTYGDLTPADIAAAQGNQYSDTAQLQTQYQSNVENMRRNLAARGQLHSGDLGYGQGQLDTQLGQNKYNLANEFLNNFRGAIENYTGALHNDELAREGAIGQAYQDVTQNPAYQPVADTSATLIPTWQSDYGVPVYQTGDGRLYTVDGSGNPVLYTG